MISREKGNIIFNIFRVLIFISKKTKSCKNLKVTTPISLQFVPKETPNQKHEKEKKRKIVTCKLEARHVQGCVSLITPSQCITEKKKRETLSLHKNIFSNF